MAAPDFDSSQFKDVFAQRQRPLQVLFQSLSLQEQADRLDPEQPQNWQAWKDSSFLLFLNAALQGARNGTEGVPAPWEMVARFALFVEGQDPENVDLFLPPADGSRDQHRVGVTLDPSLLDLSSLLDPSSRPDSSSSSLAAYRLVLMAPTPLSTLFKRSEESGRCVGGDTEGYDEENPFPCWLWLFVLEQCFPLLHVQEALRQALTAGQPSCANTLWRQEVDALLAHVRNDVDALVGVYHPRESAVGMRRFATALRERHHPGQDGLYPDRMYLYQLLAKPQVLLGVMEPVVRLLQEKLSLEQHLFLREALGENGGEEDGLFSHDIPTNDPAFQTQVFHFPGATPPPEESLPPLSLLTDLYKVIAWWHYDPRQ